MKAVLDTNVLVSGLISPFGASAEIIRLAVSGQLQLCHDVRIMTEYKDVLLRSKFSFNQNDVNDLLTHLENCGIAISALPLLKQLPDPHDEPFLEVALSGQVKCLITHNLKHYPAAKRQGMLVVSPAEFLGIYRKQR